MATINHKKYDEATETFKDFYVYDGKETLIFKVDGENHKVEITGTLDADNITGSGIIKTSDNGPLSGTAKYLSDGLGNDSALALSTSQAQIGGGSIGLNFPLTLRSNVNDYTKMLDWGTDVGGSWGTMTINTVSPYETILKSGEWVFQTGSTERMRITSAGNVGIGTSSPTSMLTLNGTTPFIRIERTGVPTWQIQNNTIVSDAGFSINNITNATTSFFINGTNGNVGIGTASPSGKLHVVGGDIFVGASYALKYNSTSYMTPENNVSGAEISTAGVFVVKTGSTPAERMRIDSTGNVGIGTASPQMALELVKNSTAGLGGNVYYSSRFLQDKTNFKGVFLGYDTSGQTAVIGAESAGAASELAFYTYSGSAWGERVTVTSNGLTFNGDTAAANALDDYEEGTWTPTINFSGASVGVTYNFSEGRYTKIGNKVTLNCFFSVSNKGSSTGSLAIGGFPFTLGSSTSNFCPALLRPNGVSFADQMIAYAESPSTQAYIQEITSGGVVSDITDADCATSFSFMFQITYFV